MLAGKLEESRYALPLALIGSGYRSSIPSDEKIWLKLVIGVRLRDFYLERQSDMLLWRLINTLQ